MDFHGIFQLALDENSMLQYRLRGRGVLGLNERRPLSRTFPNKSIGNVWEA